MTFVFIPSKFLWKLFETGMQWNKLSVKDMFSLNYTNGFKSIKYISPYLFMQSLKEYVVCNLCCF